jgi:hypothetical protein
MALSKQERSIRYALGVLEILYGRLWTIDLPIIEMALGEPLADGADVEKATREILELAVLAGKAREQLIDHDPRRQLWAEAVGCLRYRDAPADFDELRTAIMTCVTSCRWARAFNQRVLIELKDMNAVSPPAEFVQWQRANAERQPGTRELLPSVTDESPGA